MSHSMCCHFFFNDTATTEIYTLSLHDALPICRDGARRGCVRGRVQDARGHALHPLGAVVRGAPHVREPAARRRRRRRRDRKSTRLNSSHANISYAVFCLKKKTTHCKWSPARIR